MTFKIEKDVPLAPVGGFQTRKYPFNEMEVGDSFVVDDELVVRVRNASHQYGKSNEQKFSTRKHNGTFRCWRTE